MAYYDALIAAWNSGTQPPTGYTGTAITGGMTTAQKVAAVNSWVKVTAKPAILNVNDVINAIAPADFTSLTALQLQQLQFLLQSNATINGSAGTTVRAVFQSIFSGKATTLANLSALVTPFDSATTPWWEIPVANGGGGLASPVNLNDAAAAGLV